MEAIHPPTLVEVKELLAYGRKAISIITLAPECCSNEVIAFLQAEEIVVFAGHSNATFEEANEAFDRIQIGAVTHLYNTMSGLH